VLSRRSPRTTRSVQPCRRSATTLVHGLHPLARIVHLPSEGQAECAEGQNRPTQSDLALGHWSRALPAICERIVGRRPEHQFGMPTERSAKELLAD